MVIVMKVKPKSKRKITDYESILGREEVEAILREASEIRGLKITHVNSTHFGGGVAEILHNIIPLMNSVGLKVEWEVIEAEKEFFKVTKKIHHGLQGKLGIELSEQEIETYLKWIKKNAEKLELNGDIIVIHDYQPIALPAYREDWKDKIWVWRCHIDLTKPNPWFWEFIKKYLKYYKMIVVHLEEYVKPEIKDRCFIMPPSIDPLSDKNRDLSRDEVEKVLDRFDVKVEKPIIVKVARFDPWKDPLGAIDLYRRVKKKIEDLQLVFISILALDDPEGMEYYKKVVDYAGKDPNIHILTNLDGVLDLEVNAFQRSATIGIHLATREGFGLAVTEMLWKYKPVVARPVGGVKIQIKHGFNGFLGWTLEELEKYIARLILDEKLRNSLGLNAHNVVKEKYTIIKHVLRYLKLFKKLT